MKTLINGKRESVEEFMNRGGQIRVLPPQNVSRLMRSWSQTNYVKGAR